MLENPQLEAVTAIQSCTANVYLPPNTNVEDQPYFDVVGISKEFLERYQDRLPTGSMDYDLLEAQNGILIDDSTKMLVQFAHYNASAGDVIEIETDTGEKIKFTVMGTMAITLTFGTGTAYAACQIFGQVGLLGKLNYTFPVLHITIFLVLLCTIAAFYSVLGIRYCRKQSLVDRIKTID